MADIVSEALSPKPEVNCVSSEKEEGEYGHERDLTPNCEELAASDTDKYCVNYFPGNRGRKRKEMCADEAEEKRVTANYQERQRMMKLNTALDQLRQCLPGEFKVGYRRISKIRTLRLAASYIKKLSDILKQDAIIRESLPPQPGFEPRLPRITDVNRQGDSGEVYTPEKELCLIPPQETLTHTPPDFRYPFYAHPPSHFDSNPVFHENRHTASSTLSHLVTYPHVPQQPYFPLYPSQVCVQGFHTLHNLPVGGGVNPQL